MRRGPHRQLCHGGRLLDDLFRRDGRRRKRGSGVGDGGGGGGGRAGGATGAPSLWSRWWAAGSWSPSSSETPR